MMSEIFLLSIIFSFCCSFPQDSQNKRQQCSSLESSGWNCVPYYQCNETGYINTDGKDIFDKKQQPEFRESDDFFYRPIELDAYCNKLIETCCHLSPEAQTVPPMQCGKRNEQGVGISMRENRKTGRSKFGEWPHVCAILKQNSRNGRLINEYQCAGSLISKEVVLTAAHCVKNANEDNEKIFVRCGEWDTSSMDESFPYQEQEVAEIVIHPDFNERNIHNDFALLITEEDFDLNEHINPICLPSPGKSFKSQKCVSNGWGKDKFGSEGRYQTTLKEVKLPIVEHQQCEKRLRETRLGQYFELDDSFMCAGGEKGVDTCKGDGGGPLACQYEESGPWIQAGIVSWGIGCGDDIPAVYANVTKAACWIDKQVSCWLAKESPFHHDPSSIPSHFGFTSDDCPGEMAIGDCGVSADYQRTAEDDMYAYDDDYNYDVDTL